MFKRIKENEKIQKAKEFWKNPKTHDIAVLVFWLIFIFAVIIFVRVTTSMNVKVDKGTTDIKQVNTFENLNSYDFTYITNDLNIKGQAYDESLIFFLNNERYYYKDQVYLINDNPVVQNLDLNILKINHKMLSNLIKGLTPTEGNGFKQYVVPLDRFINLFETNTTLDLTKAATLNIVISVYLNNNKINKVILDLSNYYNLKNNTNITYPLTIYYYNINNVSDFRQSYDKIVEVMK